MIPIIHLEGIPGFTVCETSQVLAPTTTVLDEVTCWTCRIYVIQAALKAIDLSLGPQGV